MPAATLQAPAPTPVPQNKTTGTQSPRPSTRTLHGTAVSTGGPAVQLSPQHTAATAGEGGKRLYRARDGNMVELPPDITHAEAARLEAEAKVAETKLGKGPPPKPVPDVKKLAKKEEKKEKPKPEARGKKDGKGKGKAAPKAGGAPTALLKVGPSKVDCGAGEEVGAGWGAGRGAAVCDH